jgi:hypothetical protein
MLSAISRQLGAYIPELIAGSSNKKSRTNRRGCGRESNSARLFSLPYAGITQVRF